MLTTAPASKAGPGEPLDKEHRLSWWLSLLSSPSWPNWILRMSPSWGCLNIWQYCISMRQSGKTVRCCCQGNLGKPFFFSFIFLTTRWSYSFSLPHELIGLIPHHSTAASFKKKYYYSSEIDQSASSKHSWPQSSWGILCLTSPYTKLPRARDVVATVVFQRFLNATSLKCPAMTALHLCSLS